MQDGFIWRCCGETGDNIGCNSTKHKAPVSIIVNKAPIVAPKRGQKRKAEVVIPRVVESSKRKNGHSRVDIYKKSRKLSLYHPGMLISDTNIAKIDLRVQAKRQLTIIVIFELTTMNAITETWIHSWMTRDMRME